MIEIRDLYKFYDERKAIGPLSFTIEAGEVVGLLGLNGAGKTTTLRILACDLLPSGGTVAVDGFDVVDDPHAVRARIGYLPDRPPLYDEMTVRAFLYFTARLRGLSGPTVKRRVEEVLGTTDLRDVASELIGSLSHGFKQRVGIAQAIIHKPRLLVLDEPISGLDPVQIVEMRSLLRELKGDHTILLSSHILSEISETCDRILVIRDGEIGAEGTPDALSQALRSGIQFQMTVKIGDDETRGYRDRSVKALEIARGVDGVAAVHQVEAEGQDELTFRVEATSDVRSEVCAALVKQGIGILELTRGKRQLESVFLQLATGEGRAQSAASEEAADSTDEAAEDEDAEDEAPPEDDAGSDDSDDEDEAPAKEDEA